MKINLRAEDLNLFPDAEMVGLCDEIDLSFNDIVELPSQRPRGVLISSLNLSYNKIEIIPDWLCELSSLHTLVLTGNPLDEFPPELVEAICLKHLVIDKVDLDTVPSIPYDLEWRSLSLCGNDIREIPEKFFSHLPYLEDLKLSGNRIPAFPNDLCQAGKLRTLDISYSGLKEFPPVGSTFPSLVKANLANNGLKGLQGDFPVLKDLNLSGNRFDRFDGHLGEFPALEHLDLSACGLETVPDQIRNLSRLVSLNLAANSLTELPAFVFELPALEELFIGVNQIQSLPRIDPRKVPPPNLRIFLSGNPAEPGKWDAPESFRNRIIQ